MNGISMRSRFYMLPILVMISCAFLFSLQAKAGRQGDASITLKASNIALSSVFKAIYHQTKMAILYNNNMLNDKEKVDVNFQEAKLDEVLFFLLDKRGLSWIYNGTYISVSPKKKDGQEAQHTSLRNDTNAIARTISGKVTDAAGAPLIGATVQVKGTGVGATTDEDGKFAVAPVAGRNILVISSVGYETMEVPIGGKNILARLNVLVNDLDETVVVAYSTTTRRMNTGSISVVRKEDIEKQPVNNPLLALQGRVPGLFVTQNTGVSGSAVSIQLRGINSISNGNDPFFVIDGVPYTSQLLQNYGYPVLGSPRGNSVQSGNPLSYLSPDVIESITVLKDADATAIYGSRAANGAILITTKRGKAGSSKVDVNLQQGWGKVSRKLDMLNIRGYLQMRHEALNNDGKAPGPSDYDLNGTWDSTRNTDWQKELIGGTSHYTNVNATVSGGSPNIQYLAGTSYHRETSVFPGDFSDTKGTVYFNITSSSANRKLKFQLGANYLIGNNQLPNTDITFMATYLAPNAPQLKNPDGSVNWEQDATGTSTFYYNPLTFLLNRYRIKSNNLNSNGSVSYQVLPWLELLTTFGYNRLQTDEFIANPLTAIQPEFRPYSQRGASYGYNTISSWIAEPQISFKKAIGRGRITSLLGTSIQQSRSNGLQLYGSGYNSDLVLEDVRAAAAVLVNSSTADIYKYNAVFGKLNYTWENKYIINLTGRRDGSSRFGPADRFHNFGSIGVGWIFSEENFTKKYFPCLSFGKLRASYGTTGSDQIGNYGFMSLYQPITVGVPYQGGTALEPNRFTNPFLQWEETKKLEFGLETGFFKDRILLTASFFRNRSSNQLLSYTLPLFTGFGSVTRNFPATVQNTGWELVLNTHNLETPGFSWETNFNITIPSNKLVAFPNLATSTYASTLIIGEPVTTRKLPDFYRVNPETGKYEFLDSKGNPTYTPVRGDYIPVNTGTPRFYGGLGNTLRYKGIQLDFLFQFVDQLGKNYRFGNNPGTFARGNQPSYVLERWQNPGDVTSVQRFDGAGKISRQYDLANLSNASYSDASYIRLKNVAVSWQLPMQWIRRAHLQSCSIYAQGQNLLLITKYKGLDPETLSSRTLPPLRVITAGIKLGL